LDILIHKQRKNCLKGTVPPNCLMVQVIKLHPRLYRKSKMSVVLSLQRNSDFSRASWWQCEL